MVERKAKNPIKDKEVTKMAQDPVCKMDVGESKAKYTSERKGKKYYFCAPGCKRGPSMKTRRSTSDPLTLEKSHMPAMFGCGLLTVVGRVT